MMITYEEWRTKYLRRTGTDGQSVYVASNLDGLSGGPEVVTVSEATGYGMCISVLSDNRGDFDGLLAFYLQHLNRNGLMTWQLVKQGGRIMANPDPEAQSSNSATDGNIDVAFALLLAGRVWGCERYRAEGIRVCASLFRCCVNPATHLPMLGDWTGGPRDRCGPRPDIAYCDVLRVSDLALTHFLLFAQEDEARREGWRAVVEAGVAVLADHAARTPSGLFPDFMQRSPADAQFHPVVGRVLERENDGDFSWNSSRVPWRLAMAFWETGDARLRGVMEKMARFFAAQDEVKAGYTLQGEPLQAFSSICFLAPVWCLFKVLGTDDAALARVEAKIVDQTQHGWGGYFGESILLLARLQMTRRWLELQPDDCLSTVECLEGLRNEGRPLDPQGEQGGEPQGDAPGEPQQATPSAAAAAATAAAAAAEPAAPPTAPTGGWGPPGGQQQP